MGASPQERDRYLKGVLGDLKKLLQSMTQMHASEIGLAVEDDKLLSYATGVKKAILEGAELRKVLSRVCSIVNLTWVGV